MNILTEGVPQPNSGNPLAKYMRMPGVQVRLPTNGVFLPPGSVEFTITGELLVYPMRSMDELLLKSPDALMSGYAVEELLRSCVPGIKTPRLISSPDLDVLLLAIQAATNGEVIHFSPVCPACEAKNTVHRSLGFLMTTMKTIERDNPVQLSPELTAHVRPYTMENATRLSVVSFQEARKFQAIEDADVAVRSAQVNQSMHAIIQVTIELMADCVLKIVTPDEEVTDPAFIRQFLGDVKKPWTDKLQAKLEELNKMGIEKSYDVTCSECQHEWRPEIEFDPATFFATSS